MVLDYYADDEVVQHSVADPLVSRLREFGVLVYDECRDYLEGNDLLLKETDYCNMTYMLKKQKSVAIVVTKELFGDLALLIELDAVSKLYALGHIKVYCVFMGVGLDDLPKRLSWLENAYILNIRMTKDADGNRVPKYGDVVWVASVIAEQYWKERAIGDGVNIDVQEPDISEYIRYSPLKKDAFVKELTDIYDSIDKHNYSKKIVVLNILARYIAVFNAGSIRECDNIKCFQYIMEIACENRPVSKREMSIACNCMIDLMEQIRCNG